MFNKKFLSPGKVRKEIFRILWDYEHNFSRGHRFKQLQLSIKVPENIGGFLFAGEVPNVKEYFTELDRLIYGYPMQAMSDNHILGGHTRVYRFRTQKDANTPALIYAIRQFGQLQRHLSISFEAHEEAHVICKIGLRSSLEQRLANMTRLNPNTFSDLDEELISEVSGANALLYSGFLHKHPNPRGFINLMIQSGIYPHQIHDFIGYLDHNKIVENSL